MDSAVQTFLNRPLIIQSFELLIDCKEGPQLFSMRVKLDNQILYIHQDDLPLFKKGGPVVRNSYFWALRAIAGYAPRHGDWEYEAEVWVALKRVLIAFQESGYLGLSETQLEFPVDQPEIPDALRDVSTWQSLN
jgi:hypothetical protein